MTVRLTSPVLGQPVGYAYTGPLESWLVNEGYATTSAAVPDAWAADANGVPGSAAPTVVVTPTAAKVTATSNAVNIVTGGNLVLATKDGVMTTVALAAADTPAAAATKIDTAMAGLADAAIVSSKLEVTSIATGTKAYVRVVSGTGTVLANLGLTAGQTAFGGDGRPAGASNIGVQADLPINDATSPVNREAPYFPSTPDRHATIANDAAHLTLETNPAPGFDLDLSGTDAEAPANLDVKPRELPLAGRKVAITGTNLEGVTGVTFGGTAGTSLDVSRAGDGVITVVAPAKAAGTYDVVVTDDIGSTTKTGGVLYA